MGKLIHSQSQRHLGSVVGIHAVHADGQLGRQLGPDGLHEWLLVVPKHLGQACRRGRRGAVPNVWNEIS